MKFRNILLTTFAASAFVIGTTSCSDSFLDEKMYSSYGPEVSDVNAKLVGLHRQYAAIWGMSSQQGFVGCWQVGTDVGAPGDTQGVEVPFYRYQELNAENAGVSFLWENYMSSLIVRIRLSLHKLKAVMRRQQPKPCFFVLMHTICW